MQQGQLGTGIDAELIGQHAAHVLEGGQRVGLPAAAVQAQHELRVELLLQRMRRGQLAEFGHDLAMPAEVQVGVDPGDQRLHPLVLDGRHLAVPQQLRRHVGQRLAAPQRERLAQQVRRFRPAASLGRGVATRSQHAERPYVQLAVLDRDQVTGRLGLDQVGPGRPQGRAQPLHRAVQRTPGPGR